MKALCFISFAISVLAYPVTANTQSRPCARILKDLDSLSQQIGAHADSYWARRRQYIELKRGGRSANADHTKAAEREKADATASKISVPKLLENFRAVASEAQSQQCLPPARLTALREPTIKLARKINFDRFPEDESVRGEEDDATTVPPSMPK